MESDTESPYHLFERASEATELSLSNTPALRGSLSPTFPRAVEQGHHAGDVKQMGGSSKYDMVESDDDDCPSAPHKPGEGLVGSLAEGAPPPSTLAPVYTTLPLSRCPIICLVLCRVARCVARSV